jgi:DNA-binding MarR family transcriptional regulator
MPYATDGARALPELGRTLQLLGALWDVNHALEVCSSRMLRTAGITAQQRLIIRIVGKLGPISAGVLARILHVHPGTLSAALTRMESRGLVRRERDADDARRVMIRLTSAGRHLDRGSRGTAERAVSTILRQVTPQRAKALTDTLAALAAQLRALDRAAP